MTDLLSENGLQVSTNTELVEDLTANFQKIYGDDVALGQESPDGQMLNIFAQGGTDIRELLLQIYNSFDPDNCSGSVLDERCAINNISRLGGSFTTVDIEIVVDRTVTLEGLDDDYNDVTGTGYTIQDDAGNRFILANSQTLEAGTHSVVFRAEEIGRVEVLPETITTPVTIVLGVISVNNPASALSVGEDEETDAELKIRRRQSVSIGSSGYLNGLLAAILQLDGVTDAALYENYGSTTDSYGIPPHCIWLVVEGGSSEDIANTIYMKKSYGCDMKGDITYTITTASYQQFVAQWDEPSTQNFYLRFNIQPTTSITTFDIDSITNYILNNVSFSIGESADTANLTILAQEAIDNNGGNGLALSVEISTDGSTWVEYISEVVATKLVLADVSITVLT